MRTFLFISNTGYLVSLAQRVEEEGNKSFFYINNSKFDSVGDGLVIKSPVISQLIDSNNFIDRETLEALLEVKPDVIIIDSTINGFGRLAEVLIRSRKLVIGSSLFSEHTSIDDSYTSTLLTACKIAQPTPQVYLEAPQVIDFTTEVWYDGRVISNPYYLFNEDRFMEGGIGPVCSGMGTLLIEGSLKDPVYERGLGRLTPYLKKTNYKGPVSLRSLLIGNELYGLEINCGFSNSIFPFIENYKGNLGELLYFTALGKCREVKFKNRYSISVALVVKPFPLNIPQKFSEGLEIKGIKEENLKHMWFNDVAKVNKDNYVCTGSTGKLGYVTARGITIREAQKRAYRTIKNLRISEVMYRRDIGNLNYNYLNNLSLLT